MTKEEKAKELGDFLRYCIKNGIEPVGQEYIECPHLTVGIGVPVLSPDKLAEEYLNEKED